MTDEQIKKVANDHRKKKISFADRIAMQKIRAERAMQVDWIITVKDPSKKKEKKTCPLCGSLTQNAMKHMAAKHPEVKEGVVFGSESLVDPWHLPNNGAQFNLPFRQYSERRVVEQIAKGIVEFLLRWDKPFALNFPYQKSLILAVVAQVCILFCLSIGIRQGYKLSKF
jgi:protein-tyrosine-phosphatase